MSSNRLTPQRVRSASTWSGLSPAVLTRICCRRLVRRARAWFCPHALLRAARFEDAAIRSRGQLKIAETANTAHRGGEVTCALGICLQASSYLAVSGNKPSQAKGRPRSLPLFGAANRAPT